MHRARESLVSAPPFIVLTCDAGVRVALCCATDVAPTLSAIAEEIIAGGAQVDVVSGVERAPARLLEAVRRTHGPALFVLCRRGPAPDPGAMRELYRQVATADHRWLDCDLADERVESIGRRIAAAIADLGIGRQTRDPLVPHEAAIDDLFDVPSRAEPAPARDDVSGVIAIVEPVVHPPVPGASEPRRRRRRALVLASLAAASALTLAVATRSPTPAPDEPVQVEPAPAPDGASVAAVTPIPAPPPAPIAAPVVVPTIPVPVVVPPPSPPSPEPMPGDDRTQLDIAIERDLVAVHRGLAVAEPIMGERPWRDAMTTCRARPFWHARGWRVPTKKELVALAHAGVLPQAPVWSATRADRRGRAAYLVEGHDGSVGTAAKDEASAITVCVKRI
jgi:hypothetical protein